jgi:hypothetical protein
MSNVLAVDDVTMAGDLEALRRDRPTPPASDER